MTKTVLHVYTHTPKAQTKDVRPVDVARDPKTASDDELRWAISLFKKTVSPGGTGPRSQAIKAMTEELQRRGKDSSPTKDAPRAVIKTVRSSEENISRQSVTYDLYVDGKYVTTYHDIIAAVDARDKINAGVVG